MSAFEDDDELEFQSNPLAQEQALAADSAADADDGMESFQANPLREVWQTAEQHRRQPSSDMRRVSPRAVGDESISHDLLTSVRLCD